MTPPIPPKPPRPPTYVGDRGEVRRPRTPPRGIGLTEPPPIVEYVSEDVTGKYVGPELAEVRAIERAKRPTPDRLAKLEAKNDLLVAELLNQNKARRSLMVKIVVGVFKAIGALIALAGAYLAGRRG